MFDLFDAPRHTLRMVSYTMIPRGRGYWILAADKTDSRRTIERFARTWPCSAPVCSKRKPTRSSVRTTLCSPKTAR